VCDADLSSAALPFFRARRETVGAAPCLILRLSYVGELGYELHHPIEYQGALYEALVAAGAPLGLVDFGYRALDSMRLEKGFRLWGADISAEYTPLEARLGRFVRFDKGDFLGRDALLRQQAEGPARLLASLAVEAADADAHGHEPVRDGDRIVGHVAAGGYGHVVGQSIALAYLPAELAEAHTRLHVEILGDRRPATVVDAALYDPANERLLA
jgi:dimethylglycine dehydrogenase